MEGDNRSRTSVETTVYGKAVHQQQNLRERDHQEEDLDIDGGTTLKLILKKQYDDVSLFNVAGDGAIWRAVVNTIYRREYATASPR